MFTFAPFIVAAFISSLFLAFFLVASYWVPKYYMSVTYRLTNDDMTWRRGVWWKNTGIVPYNRITNIDIIQGPVSRKLGIASLKFQTAGYSAANTRSAEIKMDGIRNPEGMRETIMAYVKGKRPVAVSSTPEGKAHAGDVEHEMLQELVRIRKALTGRKR